MEKATSDDELIEALKAELERERALAVEERERRNNAVADAVPRVVRAAGVRPSGIPGAGGDQEELARLRRLIDQQVCTC